jgi:hypothetical protein
MDRALIGSSASTRCAAHPCFLFCSDRPQSIGEPFQHDIALHVESDEDSRLMYGEFLRTMKFNPVEAHDTCAC